ncbi:hypothetical protein GCM10027431_32760 [Lysobacter rhizosphaerae]
MSAQPLARACTREEVEFLLAYRQADKAGKRGIDKVMLAAALGLLPSAAQIRAMNPIEVAALVRSLPEVHS